MDSQIRQLLERVPVSEARDARAPIKGREAARPETPPPPATRPATASSASSASEQRLKLVIESAPVGLIIVGPGAGILAANRAALTLLGADRLEDVSGKSLGGFVASEDQDRVIAFLDHVSGGEAGSIQYVAAGPTGVRYTIDFHGVRLRRDEAAPPVVLGAMCDVSRYEKQEVDLQSQCAVLKAERDALAEDLQQAKAAQQALEQDHEALARVRADLSGAEQRHQVLAGQWTVERDAAQAALKFAEERQAELSRQLLDEQRTRQAAVESMEREHQASLLAQRAEHERLQHAVEAMSARHEDAAGAYQSQIAELTGMIRDLEDRSAALAESHRSDREAFDLERDAHRVERDTLHTELHAERARGEQSWLDREGWREGLADLLAPLKDAGVRIERLLRDSEAGDSRSREASRLAAAEQEAINALNAAPGSESGDEDPWQF